MPTIKLASETTAEAAEQVVESINNWKQNIFSIGILNTFILAAVVALATFLLIRVLSGLFKKRQEGNLRFFYRLIYVVIIVIAVFIVLSTITPLKQLSTTLLAGSGFIAVVVGIAAQASLGNVFSGISIGIAKPFVIGEVVEIVGLNIMGTVKEIGLRHTTILDFNSKYVVIPNSVIDKEVIRTVRLGNQSVCNYLTIPVGFGSDTEKAIRIIKAAALAHKDFYDVRTPEQKERGVPADIVVAALEFTEYTIPLRASIWSKDAGTGFFMLSDLRRAIVAAFAAQGIEIPYPYRNVVLQQGARPETEKSGDAG